MAKPRVLHPGGVSRCNKLVVCTQSLPQTTLDQTRPDQTGLPFLAWSVPIYLPYNSVVLGQDCRERADSKCKAMAHDQTDKIYLPLSANHRFCHPTLPPFACRVSESFRTQAFLSVCLPAGRCEKLAHSFFAGCATTRPVKDDCPSAMRSSRTRLYRKV